MAKKNKSRRDKHTKNVKRWIKSHKSVFVLFVALLAVLILLFGTKAALYINFLLGNDIVVKLNADKLSINLKRGETENVTFEAAVSANPFCKALCTYNFLDVGKWSSIEHSNFTLKPGIPIKKSYPLYAGIYGNGQTLYRFDMECKSFKTTLCQTDEVPTTRSILISVNYTINDTEKVRKEILNDRLVFLVKKAGDISGEQIAIKETMPLLINSVSSDIDISEAERLLEKNKQSLQKAKELWDVQDYEGLLELSSKIDDEITQTEEITAEQKNRLLAVISSYNQLLGNLTELRNEMAKASEPLILDKNALSKINETLSEFNNAVLIFQNKNGLEEKEKAIDRLKRIIRETSQIVGEEIKKEVLKRELDAAISYDSICSLMGICTSHLSISEMAYKSHFNLSQACIVTDKLTAFNSIISPLINKSIANQSYPGNSSFLEDMNWRAKEIRNNISLGYLSQLPENLTNSALIKELLVISPLSNFSDYPGLSLNPAIAREVIRNLPEKCQKSELVKIEDILVNAIELAESSPAEIKIEFKEPLPQCCIFGKCEPCCTTEDCKNNPAYFPVVLLHGHAVNKDISAEYSLEGFNKIQKQLEEDGYLSAGTITMYTPKDIPYGLFGAAKVPLTIRSSYYFDIFKEPENYVVVQGKSENIDTYAIRLKDIISTIKYKTGRPKVRIIAFSMGGLVARRYIQVFGAGDVYSVILIGTPNNGIVGSIANYCPIIGEKLECRDMNANSLFMNKLNRDKLPDIPVYTIAGTGCKMKEGQGDGIVLTESVVLDGAENHIINGTCQSTVNPLHLDLMKIDKYPQVYDIIKKALSAYSPK